MLLDSIFVSNASSNTLAVQMLCVTFFPFIGLFCIHSNMYQHLVFITWKQRDKKLRKCSSKDPNQIWMRLKLSSRSFIVCSTMALYVPCILLWITHSIRNCQTILTANIVFLASNSFMIYSIFKHIIFFFFADLRCWWVIIACWIETWPWKGTRWCCKYPFITKSNRKDLYYNRMRFYVQS